MLITVYYDILSNIERGNEHMKNGKIMLIGIAIYCLLSVVDRFIWKMPDFIYIPIILVGIACIMIGFIKTRTSKINKILREDRKISYNIKQSSYIE